MCCSRVTPAGAGRCGWPVINARALCIALCLALGVGGLGGYRLASLQHTASLAHMREQQAQAQQAQAQAALDLAQAARRAADAAQAQLAQALHSNQTLTQERRHALQQATTNRTCLAGPALRVLDGAPGLRLAQLPHGAAGLADPHAGAAAAAADLGTAPEWVSSEADIAGWILTAGSQYEECRARLGALIDYVQQAYVPESPPIPSSPSSP